MDVSRTLKAQADNLFGGACTLTYLHVFMLTIK